MKKTLKEFAIDAFGREGGMKTYSGGGYWCAAWRLADGEFTAYADTRERVATVALQWAAGPGELQIAWGAYPVPDKKAVPMAGLFFGDDMAWRVRFGGQWQAPTFLIHHAALTFLTGLHNGTRKPEPAADDAAAEAYIAVAHE